MTINLQSEELQKMHPRRHPMLQWMSLEEAAPLLETEDGRAKYARWVNDYNRRILQAENDELGDPFRFGWELPHWGDADALLATSKRGQCCFGGKRATKSERAAKRIVQTAMSFERAKIWVMQGTGKTSVAEQQSLIWKYLPAEIKSLSSKARHGWSKINYTIDGGFASNVIVFPNRTELHFLTYNQDVKDYQGWKLGPPPTAANRAAAAARPWLQLGAWLDEDAPYAWWELVDMRCSTYGARWLWTFSVIDGITQTIKSVVGTARTTSTRRAELLAEDRVHAEDCPAGHMPYTQEAAQPGISVIYFHTVLNPFEENYAGVRMRVEGKSDDVIKRDAYGYSTDTIAKSFPKFTRANICSVKDLPEEGTNYMITDPAGDRMWCAIWVRVSPGRSPTFFIYRDHPCEQSWGAWATPSKSSARMDGDPGPAQTNRGWGFAENKREWLRLERFYAPAELKKLRKAQEEGQTISDEQIEAALVSVGDPQRRVRLRRAFAAGDELDCKEKILERLVDSRAANTKKESSVGQTTALIQLREPQLLPNGQEAAPGMPEFRAASGQHIDLGLIMINDLLAYDTAQPLCPRVNEPHLYVSEECKQVVNMMTQYTGQDGETGAWKDFSDLVRYAVTSGLVHVDGDRIKTRGGGSY